MSDAERQAAARNRVPVGTDTYAKLVFTLVQAGGVCGSLSCIYRAFDCCTEPAGASRAHLHVNDRFPKKSLFYHIKSFNIFSLLIAKDAPFSGAQILRADDCSEKWKEAVFRRPSPWYSNKNHALS